MSDIGFDRGSGLPITRARAAWQGRLDTRGFVIGTLFVCLVLQRFAIPAGGDLAISVATPLVLLLALWGLASDTLAIDRGRAALFFGLVATALVAVAVRISVPLAIAPRLSMTSLLYWLAITSFATLRFARPMDETAFYRLVSLCLALLAVAGIAQFVAQFVGLRLFSFTGIVPDRLLIEYQYAPVLTVGNGLFRSNGFFLVEPSVFSQFMAIGVVAEAISLRRPLRLALFFAGLLASVSGTGWLVLGSYVAVLAFTSGGRGMLASVALACVAAIAFTAVSLVVPAVTDDLASRVGELSLPGTSGNERFVTPFMALHSVLEVAPWTFFTGIGPGGSEQLTVPYFYRLNTPVKILMEYGIFGLFFYLGLLVRGVRPRQQTILLVPVLVLLLLTGGYHQFSPILFSCLLMGTVATLRAIPASQ